MSPRSGCESNEMPRRTASLINRNRNVPVTASHTREVILERAASWPRLTASHFSSGIAFVAKPEANLLEDLPLRILAQCKETCTRPGEPQSILKASGASRHVDEKVKRAVRFPVDVLLWDAAERNDTIEMTELLEKVPKRNASWLSRIQMDGSINLHEEENDFPLDVTTHEGVSLLHMCAMNGNEHLVRLLLGRGAAPDLIDCDGWTPLHAAANAGRIDIVYDLVTAGAVIPDLEPSERMDGLQGAAANKTVLSIIEELRVSQSTSTAV